MFWLGLLSFAALWVYGLNLTQRWRYRHIPGPRPSWLLGNAIAIRDTLPPFAYADWKRTYGPLFRAYIGLQPIVVISDPDLAREVGVKQFAAFHDRPMIMVALASGKRYAATAAGMLQASGAYWARVRAAAQPLFHSSSLTAYTPNMVSCAEELAGQLDEAARAGQPIDFYQHAGRLALDVTGTTVLGVPFNSQASGKQGSEMALVTAFKAIFGTGSLNSGFHVLQALMPKAAHYIIGWLAVIWPTTKWRSIDAGRNAMFGLSASLVDNAWQDLQRRGMTVTTIREPGWKWFSEEQYRARVADLPSDDSLISRMLRAKNKETGAGLTDKQVVAQSNSFMIAGFETTANALSFAVYLLSQHPDVQQKLVAEVTALGSGDLSHDDLPRLPYTEAVIYEVLRMFPPVPLTPRISAAATKVGGYHLPKGTWVHIDIWGVHHDAKYWPQPDVFRPERFLSGAAEAEGRHPNAFLAFGLGPRMCIGYKLAMQEAVIVLARIYRDFSFRLVSPAPLALRFGLTLQPKHGVPVYVERRRGTAAA